MKPGKIEITDNGFKIHFGKTVPSDLRRGHTPHRGGAGIHTDKRRKNVRVRGNNAKRTWLDSES
jgi:hypothetical protein